LIERGLANYGSGDLPQALGLWREALQIEPGNEEARKLVAFVEERMSAKTPVPPRASSREPSPFPGEAEDWNTDEVTAPGGDGRPRLSPAVDAQADAEDGMRKRRQTLVSILPELLAPSTLPEHARRAATVITVVPAPGPAPMPKHSSGAWMAPRPLVSLDDDAVPQAPVGEVITRQVSAELPVAPRPFLRTDTPLDLALGEARDRGKILLRQVHEALAGNQNEMAATASEDLLQLGEKSPAPGIVDVIEPARSTLERAFFAHLGRSGIPTMAVDDATVNASSFDHRTGFLLSCIDGTLPIETLIDISGMGRFEAARTLSRLLRRKVIKVGK
jgi:hypothetical protein